jgi:cell division septum initiation protein DivIVA
MSEELTRSGEGLFKPSRRGYDRMEVDAYVAQLHRQIHDLQAQASSPDVAVRSALERVGGEVAGVLRSAHDSADEIVAQAEREASDHREAAARHAAEVTAAAEQRVHELDLDTDRIWAERERIVADARDLSRQLQAVADLAAERFPQDQNTQQGAAVEQQGLGFGGDRAAGFDELNASN